VSKHETKFVSVRNGGRFETRAAALAQHCRVYKLFYAGFKREVVFTMRGEGGGGGCSLVQRGEVGGGGQTFTSQIPEQGSAA